MKLINFGYVLLSCVYSVRSSYPKYYMDELCKNNIDNITLKDPNNLYDSTAVIKSSRSLDYPRGLSCKVTIYPPQDGDYGLVASIEYLGMRLERLSNERCMDYITISLWEGVGYDKVYQGCKSLEKQFFTDLIPNKGGIQVDMKTAMDIDPIKRGFDLTLTVFSKEQLHRDQPYLFQCDNGNFITKEVICDRRSNCADASDEFMHGGANCKTQRAKFALILGTLFGVVFVGGIIIMYWSRRSRLQRNRVLISTVSNGRMSQPTQTYRTLP